MSGSVIKMAYYSFAVLLVLAFATFVASGPVQRSDEHNIYDCVGTPTKLEYQGRHSKEGKFLQIVSETLFIPQSGTLARKIVCVQIVDQDTNDRGGYPRVVNGGNGHNFVQVSLTSQRSKGYNFLVQIYS